MYVCKESIEHVLLLHGPEDGSGEHGAAHGTMGHGESMATAHAGHASSHLDEIDLAIPTHLLILSTVACMCTCIFLRNHASLTDGESSTFARANIIEQIMQRSDRKRMVYVLVSPRRANHAYQAYQAAYSYLIHSL